MTHDYDGFRRVAYGEECATFVPVCPKCGRFVKADESIEFAKDGSIGDNLPANATCKRCGRISMPCDGFIDYE